MPDTTSEPTPRSRGGRHYPGRPDLDRANAMFRRAVAKVFRDPDPATSAKAASLVAEAVAALDAVTAKALKAQEDSTHHRAYMARKEAEFGRLIRRAARQGHPLADLLAAQGQRRRAQCGPPDDTA